jgi:uncharacterized protein YcgI (DUF1989 family)
VILVAVLVPGGFGRAVAAPIGARVTVIDLHGQQAGDFVAVNRDDISEGLSGAGARRAFLLSMSTIVPTLRSNENKGVWYHD